MSAVRDVLTNIRGLIARYGGMGITEMETRASLINPLLLGELSFKEMRT